MKLFTTVDITQTNCIRNYKPQGYSGSQESWDFLRNQQRNYDTVKQLLGLRSQPEILKSPIKLISQKSEDYKFETTQETITVWILEFDYGIVNDNLLINLISDFDHVPIITDLEETKVIKPYFCNENINFEI
jgi:hypothetical protein